MHGCETENSVRIAVDETDAARQIVEHLSGQGHKKLTYITDALPSHHLRLNALKTAALSAGMDFVPVVSEEKDAFAVGLLSTQELLKAELESDALVCSTDKIAMGALHALAEGGVDVPGKIAVTGFDDIPAASQFIPPISTVRQPFKEMARQAFKAVMESGEPEVIFAQGEFIARKTA